MVKMICLTGQKVGPVEVNTGMVEMTMDLVTEEWSATAGRKILLQHQQQIQQYLM
jgi:hypothetical protein